ncbi:MAG: alpha/beta fold hydrolase [Planctomycetes bacterium]|nr:alpha/beta fold hydrolase [Planctomycetota bacterium]
MPNSDFCIDLGSGQRIVGEQLAGASPGYLFLHGLGSSRVGEKSDSLLRWARHHGRACTRCDFRGHGESTGTIGEVTIGDLIDDTVRMLQRIGPAVVVGSSLGGMIGAFAAARHPELVTALALIAPAFGFLHRLERTVDAEGRLWTSDGRSFVLAQNVIDEARTFDERGLPQRLDLPILIVHGDADEVVPHARSARFFANLPHADKELWIVPGGDHRLHAVTESIWQRLDALVG